MNNIITCVYFTLNIINLMGEKWVKDSFESLYHQDCEIIVVDYDSDDYIKELSEEYCFRFFRIGKTPNIEFHIRKLLNKAVYESKGNFILKVTPDCIYPNDFVEIMQNWIEEHDNTKEVFVWLFKNQKEVIGYTYLHYKPHLLFARGWDEEIGMYVGEHEYEAFLMSYVFELKNIQYKDKILIHRDHKPRSVTKNRRANLIEQRIKDKVEIPYNKKLILLKQDFMKGRKSIKNSYW